MGGGEQTFVQQAFKENWIAPLGPNVTGFEKDLEDYLEKEVHVAALSSGTAALHLALLLAGVQSGDEVLCQSFTFVASANPILHLGATPVFIDSEPETWNLCPVHLEEAINDRIAKGKKPKAIVGVHLYGMPFKAEELLVVARKYGIPLIEDSAEAMGSKYKDQQCGTLGDLAILSFNGNKIITTSGGGALITNSEALKQEAVFLATQARDEAPHYQHSRIGYNYRMSNVCAGIGRGQMQVLDEHVRLRRKNHEFYKNLFHDRKGVRLFEEPAPGFRSNHWLSCIVIDPEETEGVSATLLRLALEQENIESRPLWKPLHLQPMFQNAPYYGSGTAEDLFNRGLCLPSGSNLTAQDLDRISRCIQKTFQQAPLLSTP